MKSKLILEGYGKIEHAEISIKPLTFFIGDNNSGKSYLLSLIWAIQSMGADTPLFLGVSKLDDPCFKKIYNDFERAIEYDFDEKKGNYSFQAKDILPGLNMLLNQNKQRFVNSIFNFEDIRIDKFRVELVKDCEIRMEFSYDENSFSIKYHDGIRLRYLRASSAQKITEREMCRCLWCLLIGSIRSFNSSSVYFPAARTGFVLAKDIVNKVGRQRTFDVLMDDEQAHKQPLQPFTKPIIGFLDVLEELSVDNIKKNGNSDLVQWIESHLTRGRIAYREKEVSEVRYIPDGMDQGIPLRTASAVVTELTPLLLILKYGKGINQICYEEPEMCLHPKLQHEMGRLLIRMINSGIDIVATTHSDIILQHVNNMCKLNKIQKKGALLEQLDMSEEDCLDISKIAVYQLTDQGEYSEVQQITPTEDGFVVPTFTDALMDIFRNSTMIYDYEDEVEE